MRVALEELLVVVLGGDGSLLKLVPDLIRENKLEQIPNIMQTSREQGMVTMDKALSEAVRTGAVALATAQEYAVDINQFNALASH